MPGVANLIFCFVEGGAVFLSECAMAWALLDLGRLQSRQRVFFFFFFVASPLAGRPVRKRPSYKITKSLRRGAVCRGLLAKTKKLMLFDLLLVCNRLVFEVSFFGDSTPVHLATT